MYRGIARTYTDIGTRIPHCVHIYRAALNHNAAHEEAAELLASIQHKLLNQVCVVFGVGMPIVTPELRTWYFSLALRVPHMDLSGNSKVPNWVRFCELGFLAPTYILC